ncbi:MAG: hypothetical protein M1594_01235 [Candidatus Marsarchaeota archaeon]|nr:hypothetical protein [Candidatus Marsarchaeota archaeon]
MNEQYSKADIESVFKKASKALHKKIRFFLIGGCAMTFRNLKPSTKDVDMLFEEESSEQALFRALTEIGLEELFPGSHELDLKAKDILINSQGLQFDLFTRTVMGGLTLSNRMKARAEKYNDYNLLSVFLASKEDIYLFKAITSRPFPRDYEDLITLQQTGLNWSAIISEYKAQVKGREIEKNLLKKLSSLKKEGIVNPLMRIVK